MNDIKLTEWQEWNIDLQDFSDGGVDLTNIKKIYIGFGDRDNPVLPGGDGTVHFDNIRLYGCRPGGLHADLNGDCMVDFKDFAVLAGSWLEVKLWPE